MAHGRLPRPKRRSAALRIRFSLPGVQASTSTQHWSSPTRYAFAIKVGMTATRGAISCIALPDLFMRPAKHGAHRGNAIRAPGAQNPGVAGEPRDMIGLGGAAESRLAQGSHDLVHVHVAIVRERLDKVR